MALYNWANTVTQWHFNPDNVRNPTIVFNNVANHYGTAPGYDGTDYAVSPINFAPNINVVKPSIWTQIPLNQFGISDRAKQVILTGNCGITGVNQWKGVVYVWFRAPGSIWDLSPIDDGGYQGSFCNHVPVALDTDGIPAIEMAWGTNALDTTNWGTGLACIDTPWLNLILTGWGE